MSSVLLLSFLSSNSHHDPCPLYFFPGANVLLMRSVALFDQRCEG
jgi:hypothetical protein